MNQTKEYIKKQIRYFTMAHNKASKKGDLHKAIDYSKRIYFWENKLQSKLKKIKRGVTNR